MVGQNLHGDGVQNRREQADMSRRAYDVHTFGFNKMAIKCENSNLKPLNGTAKLKIVPCNGVERALHVPPESTVVAFYNTTLAPSGGHHLDMPSTGEE